MKKFWIILGVVVVAGLLVWLGFMLFDNDPANPLDNNGTDNGEDNGNGGDDNDNGNGTPNNDLIRVFSPEPNSQIQSPLSVTGEARGQWYFEADFPVRLLDANGRELAVTPAQAQGDWMTTNFVPFRATLTFANPTTPTGTLVLEKSNASGLPEHDAEVRIPVRFRQVATSTREVSLYYYLASKDSDASGNPRCTAAGLEEVTRTISLTNTPIQDAIRELLRGNLTQGERARGITSEFPLTGVTLTAASLSGGTLTLTFNDPSNSTSGGACRVTIMRAQIEATAKQFPGVNTVRFSPASVFQP